MNIAMVDPSLFTFSYDCELAHALVLENGSDGPSVGGRADAVVLYGRPLRSGEILPHPVTLVTQFYRAGERLPAAVRRAAKGLEHAVDMSAFTLRMARTRPDVIHFQWCPLPLFDAAVVRVLRRFAPTVLTVHDPNPYNGSETGIMSRGARQLNQVFDAIIVHSEWGKSQVERHGIEAGRTHVVRHGPLQAKASRPAVTSGGETFTIVFFGKVRSYKGVDTLVDALSRLPAELKKRIKLIVVGQPMMDVGAIQAAATAAGISVLWELRFIPDDEIDHWLSQSDLFVFPYRDIDASGVFMSCLKYGKPVIATRIGMFGEVLRHGIHGYLIDHGRPAEAFTTAIADLMTNPTSARRMGSEVARLVDTLPSWNGIARSTLSIYAEARKRWQMQDR